MLYDNPGIVTSQETHLGDLGVGDVNNLHTLHTIRTLGHFTHKLGSRLVATPHTHKPGQARLFHVRQVRHSQTPYLSFRHTLGITNTLLFTHIR